MLKGCLCKRMPETFHGLWKLHSYRKVIEFSKFRFWSRSSLLRLMFVPGGFYTVAAPTFTIFLSFLQLITFRFLLQIKKKRKNGTKKQPTKIKPIPSLWLSWRKLERKCEIDLSIGIINF